MKNEIIDDPKENSPNKGRVKTRKFIKSALILWLISIVVFVVLILVSSNYGDIKIENAKTGLLSQLSGVIFGFGICGIPIVLLFSIPLRYAEKKIDKFSK